MLCSPIESKNTEAIKPGTENESYVTPSMIITTTKYHFNPEEIPLNTSESVIGHNYNPADYDFDIVSENSNPPETSCPSNENER